MKAKPPFQLLIVDDNGREVFNRYVDLTNEHGLISLLNVEQSQNLVHDMARAIAKTEIDEHASKWYAF